MQSALASATVSNKRSPAETVVREIFDAAGVGVDGQRPSDILVKNPAFCARLLREASLGLGESYMDE